jgi:hypothetical protein
MKDKISSTSRLPQSVVIACVTNVELKPVLAETVPHSILLGFISAENPYFTNPNGQEVTSHGRSKGPSPARNEHSRISEAFIQSIHFILFLHVGA